MCIRDRCVCVFTKKHGKTSLINIHNSNHILLYILLYLNRLYNNDLSNDDAISKHRMDSGTSSSPWWSLEWAKARSGNKVNIFMYNTCVPHQYSVYKFLEYINWILVTLTSIHITMWQYMTINYWQYCIISVSYTHLDVYNWQHT